MSVTPIYRTRFKIEETAVPTNQRETSNLPDGLDGLARAINAVLKNEDEIVERFDGEIKEVYEDLQRQYQQWQQNINARKDAATKDLRIEAGRLLIEAKEKVKPGGWQRFLNGHIRRGYADCCRCMRMAGAEDPEKEREKEKADTRARVQKHRDAKRAKKTGAPASAACVTGGVTHHQPSTPSAAASYVPPAPAWDGTTAKAPGKVPPVEPHDESKCSFCAKPASEVAALVSGGTAMICDQCVSVCVDAVAKRPGATKTESKPESTDQAEITEARQQVQHLKNEIVTKNLRITKLEDDLAAAQQDAAMFRKAYEALIAQPEPAKSEPKQEPIEQVTSQTAELTIDDDPVALVTVAEIPEAPTIEVVQTENPEPEAIDGLSTTARDVLKRFQEYANSAKPAPGWLGFERLEEMGVTEETIDELLTANEIVHSPKNPNLVGIRPDWM